MIIQAVSLPIFKPLLQLTRLCPCCVYTLAADIKTKKGITLNTKYEAGPKKYQLGATWDGKVSDRSTTMKVCHSCVICVQLYMSALHAPVLCVPIICVI